VTAPVDRPSPITTREAAHGGVGRPLRFRPSRLLGRRKRLDLPRRETAADLMNINAG
jgi:hypothetical protein